ncbi:MAG: hypothetical protein IPK16_03345 [Anaerolineales bacterium]|nr:hypothetical protein [Anaerolineales bacterium]
MPTTLAIQQLQTSICVAALMDERMRRQWAQWKRRTMGGGISVVARATGLSLNTIRKAVAVARRPPPR